MMKTLRTRNATVKRGKRPLMAVWTKEWLGVVEVISVKYPSLLR
jgi:hypothetical protein